jgi:hypothetical protein
MIKRIRGRYYVTHIKKKGLIGKPIKGSPKKGFKSYEQALKQERAIMVQRYKKTR